MPKPLFENNAVGTLAGSYTAGATALTLTAGQGALFPAPSGGDYFMATIVDASNNIEIVKVTARATDTFTVVRGQEGTAARALAAGEKVELRLTAGVMEAVRDKQQQTADIADLAVTTGKIADLAVTAAKLADGAVSAAAKIADGIVTGAKLAAGAALANLGFTPVQQGGGAGQGNNKVYIGWATTKLGVQVDSTDHGFILTERDDGSAASAGYRAMPQNQQEANYQIGLSDNGRHLLHAAGGTHTYTVPNEDTPFILGATIVIVNAGGTVNLVGATGVTLNWSPTGATGARVLAAKGVATLMKIGVNNWYVFGTGLS